MSNVLDASEGTYNFMDGTIKPRIDEVQIVKTPGIPLLRVRVKANIENIKEKIVFIHNLAELKIEKMSFGFAIPEEIAKEKDEESSEIEIEYFLELPIEKLDEIEKSRKTEDVFIVLTYNCLAMTCRANNQGKSNWVRVDLQGKITKSVWANMTSEIYSAHKIIMELPPVQGELWGEMGKLKEAVKAYKTGNFREAAACCEHVLTAMKKYLKKKNNSLLITNDGKEQIDYKKLVSKNGYHDNFGETLETIHKKIMHVRSSIIHDPKSQGTKYLEIETTIYLTAILVNVVSKLVRELDF